MTSFTRRTILLLPLACAALYGCPAEETETTPDDAYADVLYEGETNDEAMVALGSALDQEDPIDDPSQAPTLDSPAAGELPKTPIPTFTWHFGKGTARAPAFIAPSFGLAMRPAAPSLPHALAQLFGPPRIASAHGDPVNGATTFLVFSTKSDARLARVFTDLTTYTPSQEVWDKLVAAGAEISLSLTGATFDNNRVADGGGPFKGSVTQLTIAP